MGFKPQKKLYKLTFEDSELAGLEVTATSVSTGQLLSVQLLTSQVKDAGTGAGIFRDLVDIFTGAMLSWNIEDDDGNPVAVSADAVLDLDPGMVMEMISAWTQAISGVAAPLAGTSPSGETSLEASMPMEILSPNRSS